MAWPVMGTNIPLASSHICPDVSRIWELLSSLGMQRSHYPNSGGETTLGPVFEHISQPEASQAGDLHIWLGALQIAELGLV